MVRSLGGRLYLAPIDETKVHKILDIGTGTGTCMFVLSTSGSGCVKTYKVLLVVAIEMGDSLPGAQV